MFSRRHHRKQSEESTRVVLGIPRPRLETALSELSVSVHLVQLELESVNRDLQRQVLEASKRMYAAYYSTKRYGLEAVETKRRKC